MEGVTHDYVRQGTTTLFAALDVANGQVLTDCKPRHRHQEFLAFLRHLDSNVPEDLEVHLIVDNYSPHKHAKVKAWLARHPRYQMHFIPTYASWLNQVERWFGLITQRTIRRGSFSSVKQLISKIDELCRLTIEPASHSCGMRLPIPSWPRSNGYVIVFRGQETSYS